jgi:predicted glycosyltransferase
MQRVIECMKILFGVFDWGLGHATRDIPLIEELLRTRNTVHIISTGRALALLRKHFGRRCEYFDVPSVGNPYTKTSFLTLSFIAFTPKMVTNLRRAHKITAKIIARERYDKVISDCRYDVYDTPDNSYLINHQVRFKSFPGCQATAELLLSHMQAHYKYIIIPDFAKHDLTGMLSHDLTFIPESRIRYIGILSQVRKLRCRKDIDCFISISGPEPQRTLLEKRILEQAGSLRGNVVIALGKPEQKRCEHRGNATIHSFLDAREQERMMNRAKFIVARPGYTTVMELNELGIRHALFIPTPGQTEQEYLADLYEKRGEFHHVSQHKLDLANDIAAAKGFSGFSRTGKTADAVRQFMEIIGQKPERAQQRHARKHVGAAG